ncbi:hypothetical protein F4X73_15150 [Candidatus Poribacteria bacterium]|nr:hypothetical protein [Candidatus Poribacteria bacterium]MYB66026.1 hypothetical protein [Candidatus Poribacteria bacterium]MYF56475.1 hypothetical protein [Candidatus Poribacteria bacterium]
MRNKVYWGLGVLIVLFIGAFVLVMVNEYAENEQLEADAKKAQEQADRNKQQKHVTDNPPTDNHSDKIPVAHPENNTQQEDQIAEPPTPVSDGELSEILEHFMQVKAPPGSNLESLQNSIRISGDPHQSIKDHPVYEEFYQFMIDYPDFDYQTATTELRQKRSRILQEMTAAIRGHAAVMNARQAALREVIEASTPEMILEDFSDKGGTE